MNHVSSFSIIRPHFQKQQISIYVMFSDIHMFFFYIYIFVFIIENKAIWFIFISVVIIIYNRFFICAYIHMYLKYVHLISSKEKIIQNIIQKLYKREALGFTCYSNIFYFLPIYTWIDSIILSQTNLSRIKLNSK